MGSDAPVAPPWRVGARAAEAVRFELNLGYGPIDVYDVAQRRGASVVFRDLGGDDGRYVFHNGAALIIVTTSCAEAARQRFTAAHELGHHELHRFAGESEAPTYLVDHDILAKGDRRESEANSFAATLLLPNEALKADFPGRPKVQPEDVGTIMRRYGVSFETAVYRLNNAGIISAPRRQALLEEGWGRVRELRGQEEQPRSDRDVPEALENSMRKLYLAGLVAPERLAEVLAISADDVVTRFGEPTRAEADVSDLIAGLDVTTEGKRG